MEGGYLSIEFFDARAQSRVKPVAATCQTRKRAVRMFSLGDMFVGEEKFLLDCVGRTGEKS